MMLEHVATSTQSTPSREPYERAKIARLTVVEYMAYVSDGDLAVKWADRAAAIAASTGRRIN
jgi:hypothetical protein